MTGEICATSLNAFCVHEKFIETCFSIFKLQRILLWMVEHFCIYKSKCKIYQVVNSD